MRHEDYAQHVLDFTQEMEDVTAIKNHDYSIRQDAMDNFKLIGEMLNISPRTVWGVLAAKHWTAIMNHMGESKKLKSETIHGRFLDLAVYAMLGDALDKDLANSSLPEKPRLIDDADVFQLNDALIALKARGCSIAAENLTRILEKIKHDQHGSEAPDRPVQRNPGDVRDKSQANGAVAESRHEPNHGPHLRGVASGN